MKVSVITVSFNAVSCIERTIKSVISQRYNDFEYILNSATHIVRNKFKILSNNILPSILPCQKIHLT